MHLVFVVFSICPLRAARITSKWKKTNVTPVHIKDSMEPTETYRPISLLCIISKVLECCVSIKLYHHVKQFISPLQHGFLRNRSCTTPLHSCYLLMPLVKTWTKILDWTWTWTWLRLSIPLITKLCFKSSNDMVRKATRFFGLQIT